VIETVRHAFRRSDLLFDLPAGRDGGDVLFDHHGSGEPDEIGAQQVFRFLLTPLHDVDLRDRPHFSEWCRGDVFPFFHQGSNGLVQPTGTRVDHPFMQRAQAPETGFVDGFAVARNPSANKAWLTHCPGVVAMARNDDPDSSRTDFYIVIGQAPRYLDRNLNIFGRVVYGMDVVQGINRGPTLKNGIIDDETKSTRISRLQVLSDIPEDNRLFTYAVDTNSDAFADLLKDRRKRKQKFFHNKPPKVLDVCQVPVNGRITK